MRPISSRKIFTRVVDQEGTKKTAHYVKIAMVSNLAVKQADKYRPLVHQFAEQYRISPSLVFAVIRTESNFNPYAVSSAPAYGLMQLVPTSGGREAYRKAKGKDVAPSRDYLFDPTNNVELGAAYLNVLMFNQLEDVEHNVSREYCVIAAYNTGPSNVFRTFSRDRTTAVNQINSLQPAGVYDQLHEQLAVRRDPPLLGKSDRLPQSLRQFVGEFQLVSYPQQPARSPWLCSTEKMRSFAKRH